MATTLSPSPDLNMRLETFADRLVFARMFIAKVKSGREFARLLDFSASTYASWEAGNTPHDRFDVATRIADRYPAVDAVWLLRGGAQISSYLCDEVRHAL